ncbi:MAG: hypothetical protein NPMRTHETA2_1260003 [Nitrosopumilales archaeon]|nr:MAG: hypothetical protein NPMRTHETA2_1260003 [Nitrosopumilales archaeon]
MLYKGEDGKYRQLKPREKMPTINDKNREYWKKRSVTWHKKKLFFDHEIKTGVCYFCKRDARAQRSRSTVLHHVKYNNDDPLDWTIEVCTKCHYQIDKDNKKIIDRHFAPRTFAKAVDREAERIALNNMSYEERMRKYVRGYPF